MSTIIKKEINYKDKDCVKRISNQLHKLILESKKKYKEIILLCIGTDRSTGDSFAPLLGTLLSKRKGLKNKLKIIGTLENPVHAKNLNQILHTIDLENSLVIVVDACLGTLKSIGNINIRNKALRPGSALNKVLPSVGDISIAGIINLSSSITFVTLQNTRLSIVYNMASKLELGINKAINQLYNKLRNVI